MSQAHTSLNSNDNRGYNGLCKWEVPCIGFASGTARIISSNPTVILSLAPLLTLLISLQEFMLRQNFNDNRVESAISCLNTCISGETIISKIFRKSVRMRFKVPICVKWKSQMVTMSKRLESTDWPWLGYTPRSAGEGTALINHMGSENRKMLFSNGSRGILTREWDGLWWAGGGGGGK